MEQLKLALSFHPRRRQVYYRLGSFIGGRLQVLPSTIDCVFSERERFNHDIVKSLNKSSLIAYFTQVTFDLENIIERFNATATGMTIVELDCVTKVLRTIFHRYYEMISIEVNPSIDGYIKHISKGINVLENCNKVIKMKDTTMVWTLVVTLMTFIIKYYTIYRNNTDKFKQRILCMVYYKGLSNAAHKRPTSKTTIQKRPKVRRRKLTYRDKRPPRIKTDLPVSMPNVALKKRLERLDKKSIKT